MVKEWYSSKELAVIAGLPATTQGINRKARVEGWKGRKRSGVQGKAIEYHIDSLPDLVRSHFHVRQSPADYVVSPVEPLQLWISTFTLLTKAEQEIIKIWLMRNGVNDFIRIIKQINTDHATICRDE